ncbi:MAG: hypothetical protein ACE5KE_07295 [Methanosarcinales archaeon]
MEFNILLCIVAHLKRLEIRPETSLESVRAAKNEIIALIDSDNILDGIYWLAKMVQLL